MRGSHAWLTWGVPIDVVCYRVLVIVGIEGPPADHEGCVLGSVSDRRRSDPEHRPATPDRPALEIHRSPRRRRSASAAFRDDRIVVRLPAGLPGREEQRLIDGVVRKVAERHGVRAAGGDEALTDRAAVLADRYLDGLRATRVTWSMRMGSRHGSCTPDEGHIRISSELAAHPSYVVDYVLVHELAHLHVSGHTPEFHALVARFPDAERARGYLEGYAAGRFAAARSPSATSIPQATRLGSGD